MNIAQNVEQQFNYETVAASQTAQVLGATGAQGDFLHRLVIETITADANADVILLDGATSIVIQTGGTGLQAGVHSIELNMISANGAWAVTTGSSATVIGVGRFT